MDDDLWSSRTLEKSCFSRRGFIFAGDVWPSIAPDITMDILSRYQQLSQILMTKSVGALSLGWREGMNNISRRRFVDIGDVWPSIGLDITTDDVRDGYTRTIESDFDDEKL